MTDDRPAKAETERPDPIDLVVELGRRFRSPDGPSVAELLHPTFHVEQPSSLPHGGVHHGPAGMAAMAEAFGRHWTRTIGPATVGQLGDQVVQVTHQRWTARATGRTAEVDVVELFTVRDGQVAAIRVFPQDTHALLDTLAPDPATTIP